MDNKSCNTGATLTELTKTRTIEAATKEYLDENTISTVADILNIEAGVLSKVHEKFDEHNALCSKDKKWKIPDTLSFSQIFLIMTSIFVIRNVRPCTQSNLSDNDLLGIYIDKNIIELLGSYEDKEGLFCTDEIIIHDIARQAFNFSITTGELRELVNALKEYGAKHKVLRCNNPDYVAVRNGIFDYATKELMEFSPEHVFLTKSNVAYNPNTTNVTIHNPQDNTDWDVESWMESLSDDPEIVQLLWEICGAVIRPNVRWNKSAWMVSEAGNNGKGTLCEMMRQLCGDGVCASISLAEFSKEFALEPLLTAQAIIVDENDVGTFIDKAADIKAIVTQDVITINRKFKPRISFQFKGFMVQCLNETPRIKDKSDSFFRRQIYIPMDKCFTGVERKYIKNEYIHREDVLEYVMFRVLNMNYYSLSEPERCKTALDEFKMANDPIRTFWDEFRSEFVWDVLPNKFLYALYKSWYEKYNESGKPLSLVNFKDALKNITKDDELWQFKVGQNLSDSKAEMSKPEMLIIEYNLADYKSSRYRGANPDRLAEYDKIASHYNQCWVRRV